MEDAQKLGRFMILWSRRVESPMLPPTAFCFMGMPAKELLLICMIS
uniref:Uncharacterized protein n=1 Tax=Arundo donax TaxID=35708 RepID=A0A0A9H4R3_ARUDO